MGDTYDQLPISDGGHGYTPPYSVKSNSPTHTESAVEDNLGSGHFVYVAREHNCQFPETETELYTVGTIWQCDDCCRQYVLKGSMKLYWVCTN